jgi:FAD/FMN-containing dehydrogenase
MPAMSKVIERARRTFSGELIGPADSGYEETRRSFNAMIDRQPALIALPTRSNSIVEAIDLARELELPLAVRGGGHSVAGHGIVEGGLIIDLRRMRGVQVDPETRRARVDGGATWADLDTAAQAHDLAVTGGIFGDTGVAGLTLGGGIGFLQGVAGLSCDNLVGLQLVTGSGDVLEIDRETDPEALWAHRGGGGNFGVVTRLDLRLFPVTEMYGGHVEFPLRDPAVIERYAAVQSSAPDNLIAELNSNHSSELGPHVQIQLAWLGDAAGGERYARELIGDLPVLGGGFHPVRYADIQAINAVKPFAAYRNYWKSTFVPDVTYDLAATIVNAIHGRRAGSSGILIEPMHGQVRRVGFEHAAFPQRSSRFHVSAMGIWTEAERDAEEIAWVRATYDRIQAFAAGGTYVNYITPDEPPDRARSAYPADVYDRLRAVKRRLDPDNLFRSNVNIAP